MTDPDTFAAAFADLPLVAILRGLVPAEVARVAAAGGRLIVMPHGDADVIAAAKAAGLVCLPGVATPTEGFTALKAGADALKLFPAESLGPTTLSAWRAVFPRATRFL